MTPYVGVILSVLTFILGVATFWQRRQLNLQIAAGQESERRTAALEKINEGIRDLNEKFATQNGRVKAAEQGLEETKRWHSDFATRLGRLEGILMGDRRATTRHQTGAGG